MGHCGYYQQFIYMYAIIARPHYALITIFIWREECKQSFNKLKACLTSAPILKSPDWNLIFHVHIDASNFVVGAILSQPSKKNMDFPISYTTKQLNTVEQNSDNTIVNNLIIASVDLPWQIQRKLYELNAHDPPKALYE